MDIGRFVLLYFLGAFSGNVFSFLLTGENGYSVGASTAVFGLIAAEVVFFYQNRKLFGGQAKQAIGNAVFIIAINLFIGLSPALTTGGMWADCSAGRCLRGSPVRAGKWRAYLLIYIWKISANLARSFWAQLS